MGPLQATGAPNANGQGIKPFGSRATRVHGRGQPAGDEFPRWLQTPDSG